MLVDALWYAEFVSTQTKQTYTLSEVFLCICVSSFVKFHLHILCSFVRTVIYLMLCIIPNYCYHSSCLFTNLHSEANIGNNVNSRWDVLGVVQLLRPSSLSTPKTLILLGSGFHFSIFRNVSYFDLNLVVCFCFYF